MSINLCLPSVALKVCIENICKQNIHAHEVKFKKKLNYLFQLLPKHPILGDRERGRGREQSLLSWASESLCSRTATGQMRAAIYRLLCLPWRTLPHRARGAALRKLQGTIEGKCDRRVRCPCSLRKVMVALFGQSCNHRIRDRICQSGRSRNCTWSMCVCVYLRGRGWTRTLLNISSTTELYPYSLQQRPKVMKTD